MLPASSLSRAAYSLRDLLISQIDEFDDIEKIKIGHPGDTVKKLEVLSENCLNLFFYDIKFAGYPSDVSSYNPYYVRLHCLITAVGSETTSSGAPGERDISKGENELRLIGEVMRVLHQQPVLSIKDSKNIEIGQLQIVPYTIDLDNLNHIWSTQNDTSYRLSIAYEMALAAIPDISATEVAPLATDPEMATWAAFSRTDKKSKQGFSRLMPVVDYLEIDTDVDNWIPHICFVERVSSGKDKIHYVFNIQGDPDAELEILVAGKDKAKVIFSWNIWRRKKDNTVVAWKEDIADSLAPLEKEIKSPLASTDPFFPNRIDPSNIDERRVVKVKIPDDILLPDTRSWQAVLYASHEYRYEKPAGSGQFITELVKSNLLMFYGDES